MANYLQLGDIIRIVAPENQALHGTTCYINYYDPNDFMELIHVSSMVTHLIRLKQGKIQDPTIQKIILLNRSMHKGFARQNGLLPNVWVDLEFGGDVRSVFVAQITHLEEDMIELTTFPERDVLYIDFAYKGIPRDIPLKQICFCQQPASYVIDAPETKPVDDDEAANAADVTTEYNADGELVMDIPENIVLEKDYRTGLHNEYTKNVSETKSVTQEQSPEEVLQDIVEYGIDAQMNFLMDDFLSSVPDDKRTRSVMRDIYIHLNRYKELREMYSNYDEYGQVRGFQQRDPKFYKPLVEQLYNLKKVPWAIPVASVTQKMYVDDTDFNSQTDVEIMDVDDEIVEESDAPDKLFWKNKVPARDGEVKYEDFYRTMNRDYYRPYSVSPDTVMEPLANNITVHDDMDMFLGHYNTHKSTHTKVVNKASVLLTREYNRKRFTGPIHYSHFLTKKQNDFHELMESDAVHLQSMMFLPDKEVQHTRLLSGNIFQQTQYTAPFLFDLVNAAPKEIRKVDLQKESTVLPLSDHFSDVRLENRPEHIHRPQLNHPLYNAFLQATIPNIFELINHYYATNSHKYNLHDYLLTFAPYCVSRESLGFGTAQSIGKHLYGNIQNYTKDLEQQRESFVTYTLAKFQPQVREKNELYHTVLEKHFAALSSKKNVVEKLFSIDDKSKHSYEQWSRVLQQQNGEAFYMWLLFVSMDLITPTNMMLPFVENQRFYDPNQKILTKKYESLVDMQADNDKRDLKYDAKYDANEYDVLQKYRRESSQYPPEQFLQFLTERLSNTHGCSLHNAQQLAEELVQGFKLVKEGDYALLEVKPHLPPGVEECKFTAKEREEIAVEAEVRKVQKYFKRINHTWVYDADVDDNSFSKAKDLTCALQNNKGEKRHDAYRVFKNYYGETMETIEENLKIRLHALEAKLNLWNKIQHNRKFEVDKYFMRLGNQAYISETIPSPYEPLLKQILRKTAGFENKQSDLVSFYTYYCRDALPNEDMNWKYCKDSKHSVPLLPSALVTLAEGFLDNQYAATLTRLVKEQKIKYEEGRFVVVHGGHILDVVEFSDLGMELFEEIDEKDTWGTTDATTTTSSHYEVDMSSGRKTYTNTKMRLAYTIIGAMCKNIFIPVDRVENQVMKLCTHFFSQRGIYLSEKRYHEQMKERHKKSNYPSYETYEKLKILYISICCLIVAIQSLVPSFEPRRTFGKCVMILDGYPLREDSGQEGTLTYIACIMRKMAGDRRTLPWSALPADIESKLKTMFGTILKYDGVQILLKEKRRHLETVQNIVPPTIEVKTSWTHFLPPLKPTGILNGKAPLRNVEAAAHQTLRKYLMSGGPDQWKYLGMYFGKILAFSFGTQEIINTIVREKETLLGKYNKTPWIENACCNELSSPQNPIQYFGLEEHDPRVLEYVTTVRKLGMFLRSAKKYLLLPYVHVNAKDQERSYDGGPNSQMGSNKTKLDVNLFCSYSEELMYRTFISYCHLDSSTKPIPHYLEPFLTEKPAEYDTKSSIEEKIAFLKEEKHLNLTVSTFQSFIKVVNRNHEVRVNYPMAISYHDKVMDALAKWEAACPNQLGLVEFRTAFTAYVNREKIGSLGKDGAEGADTNGDDDTKDTVDPSALADELLDQIYNVLVLQTDGMKRRIAKGLKESGYSDDTILSMLNKISSWKEKEITTLGLGQLVKNYMYYLCCIVPRYLHTGEGVTNLTSDTFLIDDDIYQIGRTLDEKYSYLSTFVEDSVICEMMTTLNGPLRCMYRFVSEFYGFFPSSRDKLQKQFFQFVLCFAFDLMLSVGENDRLIDKIFEKIERKNEEDEDNYLDGGANSDDDLNDSGMERVEINSIDKYTVRSKMAKLIHALLSNRNAFHRDKTELLLSYDSIRENNDRHEDDEKIKMTTRFRKILEHRTRRAEKELKNYHLGEYFVDPKVIKTYGRRRDAMLNTRDRRDEDILYRDEEGDMDPTMVAELAEFLDNNPLLEDDIYDDEAREFRELPIARNDDDIFDENGNIDDDFDENIGFLGNYEEDDNYDIAENALERLE